MYAFGRLDGPTPGDDVVKLFFFVTDAADKQAREFIPDNHIQPSLLFASKAISPMPHSQMLD
jgi:hypothetical protein